MRCCWKNITLELFAEMIKLSFLFEINFIVNTRKEVWTVD